MFSASVGVLSVYCEVRLCSLPCCCCHGCLSGPCWVWFSVAVAPPHVETSVPLTAWVWCALLRPSPTSASLGAL
eukprot:1972889-Alexandrium_andersonii.AAC.1